MTTTTIFALGSNGSGQLGILHHEDVSVPKPVVFDPSPLTGNIACLAAGGNHTLLLTDAGDVYCAGDASTGACGLTGHLAADTTTPSVFRKLELGIGGGGDDDARSCLNAAMVAVTWEASILVLRDDAGRATRVYTLGTGHKGELGLGDLLVKSPSGTLLSDFPPTSTSADALEIVDLAACMSHAVAVLSNGAVYGWGAGRKGQLGTPASATISRPRLIEGIPFPVVRAVCGRDFTALFAAPSDGRVVVLGSDRWGLHDIPQVRDWVDVGASWGAVYILDKAGTVRGWGRDDHGGLPPAGLPRIARLAPGSEHVVALSEDGGVLAWGWGEHGNCGPTAAGAVDVKGTWNVVASKKYVPPGCEISGIGAGCATSWVYITGLQS